VEDDATHKRNRVAAGSRQSINDFEDDTGEDSTESEEGAGRDSDGELNNTPPTSLGVARVKEPAGLKTDQHVGKNSSSKRGKRGHPLNRKTLPMKTRAAAQKGRQ
jgi:hypothetical protein